jgi:hypothetical protein
MYKYNVASDRLHSLLVCQTKSPVSAGASSFAKKIDNNRKTNIGKTNAKKRFINE